MAWISAILALLGFIPLGQAVRANRETTLHSSLGWAFAAWLAWTGVAWERILWPSSGQTWLVYTALCLTGCAGVAVLGARRPGVAAWNFVVAALLAVLLLPILKGWGEPRLEAAQELFLSATLAVSLLNYLPTRLRWGMSLIAAGCGVEMARLIGWIEPARLGELSLILVTLAPWAAWSGASQPGGSATGFDRLWLSYRDRFGFVWGQRIRQQFNHAARNAGWPVELRWSGLQATESKASPNPEALLAVLYAVVKRFRKTAEEVPGGTQ